MLCLLNTFYSKDAWCNCHKNQSTMTSNMAMLIKHISAKTGRVSLVEQELLYLPEHLSSSRGFSGVHVTRSLVLCVSFVDHCLSFCPFSFDHCVVCPSSIDGF